MFLFWDRQFDDTIVFDLDMVISLVSANQIIVEYLKKLGHLN